MGVGTPAEEHFVTRPPILGSSFRDICALAQTWINKCGNHESCDSVQKTDLPARILSLSGDIGNISVKLVENTGARARYCALSHCWGPVDKRPLRTTRDNLEQHMLDITFSHMPKTFREAISFAYGLGVEYIWIDSLCIIQDDAQDWHMQAANMRTVYRNAFIVILAAGAKDSSEGLFVTERPNPIVYETPFLSERSIRGKVKIALIPWCEGSRVSDGPLYHRAWVSLVNSVSVSM